MVTQRLIMEINEELVDLRLDWGSLYSHLVPDNSLAHEHHSANHVFDTSITSKVLPSTLNATTGDSWLETTVSCLRLFTCFITWRPHNAPTRSEVVGA